MKKPILIYGAGGLGKEVLSLLRALPEWEPVGFIDDFAPAHTVVAGVPVLGTIETITPDISSMVLAVGDPALKAKVLQKIKNYKVAFPTLIHPTAVIQDRSSVYLGAGTIVSAGCILTTDIHIGDHVLINLNSTIGHDTKIGSFSSIMPGVNVAGEVTIGECVLVGSGANILNRVQVGSDCRVGMGSVVLSDVGPGLTVAGVPAKRISK